MSLRLSIKHDTDHVCCLFAAIIVLMMMIHQFTACSRCDLQILGFKTEVTL